MSSEVARIRQQIELELAAMRLGLSGLSAGTARHQFIEAKMQRLGKYEEQLAEHIGKTKAEQVYCQAYMRVMEEQA
jgi:folate-dependent phosphoribosylglycinamide formyltransferase PurN